MACATSHPSNLISTQAESNTLTLPEASTSTLNSPPVKQKRKQLSACDSCRLRRVKCDRYQPDVSCTLCSQRNLKCTSNYISTVSGLREGKNVKQARAQFGEVTETNTDSHSLLPVSTENILVNNTFSVEMARQLITSYYSFVHNQFPAIDFLVFQERLSKTNPPFHFPSLFPADEFLAYAVAASGARYTFAAGVLGNSPPPPNRSIFSQTIDKNSNLAEWGKRRDRICLELLHLARTKLEPALTSTGGASAIVAAACITLGVLEYDRYELQKAVNWSSRSTTITKPRDMPGLAIQAIRQLIVDKRSFTDEEHARELETALGGRLFWTFFLWDSFVHSRSGSQAIITQADIDLCIPSLVKDDFVKDLQSIFSSEDQVFTQVVAIRFAGRVGCLARRMAKDVINLREDPVKINPSVVAEILIQVESCWIVIDTMKMRQDSLPANTIGTTSIKAWERNVTVALIEILGVLEEVLTDAVTTQISQGHVEQTSRLLAFKALQKPIEIRIVTALRRLAELFRTSLGPGDTISAASMTLKRLWVHAARLLMSPVTSEGGPPNWTLVNKLADVESVMSVLRSFGWMWGEYGEICRRLQLAIETCAKGTPGSQLDLHASFIHSTFDGFKPVPCFSTPAARPINLEKGFLDLLDDSSHNSPWENMSSNSHGSSSTSNFAFEIQTTNAKIDSPKLSSNRTSEPGSIAQMTTFSDQPVDMSWFLGNLSQDLTAVTNIDGSGIGSYDWMQEWYSEPMISGDTFMQ